MTLEEIERILRGVADGRPPDEHGRRVLRAAVSLLPVVRAAEEWRDAKPGSPKWAAKAWRMRDAVDQMRRETEEK